ncbi:DUF4249 domain-containing protein [Flagellimonas pacifica]|uniref:DUF4249 domain-containing protein n=1 Tax=Flagellimonas pacifica TaxID=1247520 RepID=A0A285MTG8_9FLAO|nr:DUF4249 domain-containing protein [Allomuricauda parva]SNZ00485.1 protein of unknown function [Allomuricauda parva]
MAHKALKNTCWIVFLAITGLVTNSCIESFVPETGIFDDALVIESTITTEVKEQQVFLNRAFRFEEFVPVPEENAKVIVKDDLGDEHSFQETSPGKYTSDVAFGAQPDRSYQLLVTTSDGKEYSSDAVLAPKISPIHGLKANRVVSGEDGMEILVEYDDSQTSTFFRYQFEETYQIIAPDWTGSELRAVAPFVLVVWPLDREERVCYKTDVSNDIIVNRPLETNQNNVLEFQVRFIDRNNYIISHRYSVLVKQLSISEESYRYLKKLDESSGGDDLFSPSQPGFFRGNVRSTNNQDEKVLGFFHVASVSSKRIFFNYSDFFPNEDLPPYVDGCLPFKPPTQSVNGEPTIFEMVANNVVRYHGTDAFGEFIVVPRVCADCTVLGDPNVPEFWEE